MRGGILALGLLGGLALAGVSCGDSIEDLLYKALCTDDSDCAPKHECKFNNDILVGLQQTSVVGWCLESGDEICIKGEQPFCSCADVNIADPTANRCPGYSDREAPRPGLVMMYATFAGAGEQCVCVPSGTFDPCKSDGTCDSGTPSAPTAEQGCFCIE